jgi:tripartite-type tricarboxylate transporter receptor subunit TctC
MGAPSGTQDEIIEKLNSAINAGLTDPEVKARIVSFGYTMLAGSPGDYRNVIIAEIEKWRPLLTEWVPLYGNEGIALQNPTPIP